MDDHYDFDAVVIGAGFAGLYALHKFRDDLTMSVRVFEAGDGVGGTWYWNRYPGARCDSESYYYCYSFSRELAHEWKWSGRYPEQPEIERYLNHVADRFDLRRDIQLSTRVTAATFDDAANRWEIRTDHDDTVTARFLVTAVGCLSAPISPDIPGLDGFEGDIYFTATWPRDGVDFTGKRVGLIGTGSSGIQATPPIADPGRSPHRLPADAELQPPGAPRRVPGGGPGEDQEQLRRDLRRDPHVVCRLPVLTDRPHHDERLGRGARGDPRGVSGRRADSSSCGVVSRTCCTIPKPTRSRPSSSATRSGRRSRIRTPPNCSARRAIPTGPSARRSTPSTTRRSTATT